MARTSAARRRWFVAWCSRQPPTLTAALRHLFDHHCIRRGPARPRNPFNCPHLSKAEHALIDAWVADIVEWHLWPERHQPKSEGGDAA